MGEAWVLSERQHTWVVHRHGELEHAGDAEACWAYVAERAADDDLVLVRYSTERDGRPLTGQALRELLDQQR